tara:strand:+ start:127 stop:1065 length:939 start_codon:yes stop_codon:yes gene_type:complete
MSFTFVFPGQGAQSIGMGQALAKAYSKARNVFEEVDDALKFKLSELIWEGSIDDLTLTKNAQPALMATSIAAFRAIEEEGLIPDNISFFAGHSLGEYSALCAAGALELSVTAKLLRTRGEAMQKAVPIGIGGMAAILGLDFQTVENIAAQAAQTKICQAANDNDPKQVVISGNLEAVERAIIIAKESGAKRAILLPVSAPFHCKLMQPASNIMEEALSKVTIKKPKVPILANYSALPVVEPSDIKDSLVDQIMGRVRWRESIEYLYKNGVKYVYEVGAGKALSGMIKRINKDITCQNIGSPEDLNKILFIKS